MHQNNTLYTTVMFADVSGSSRLYQELGNAEAERRIAVSIAGMTVITREHRGAVIKTIGDEIMAHFSDPSDACAAAMAIQCSDRISLPIRIGMAHGAAIMRDGDLFGQAVNDAAAIARIAKGEQILLDDATASNLNADCRLRLQLFDRVRLKGSTIETQLHRVNWQADTRSQTSCHTVIIPASMKLRDEVTLVCDGNTYHIRKEQTPFKIGRSSDCHLVVLAELASREHCDITYQRGKFVLVDRSTNGTWVHTADNNDVYLRREEFPLLGKGTITLGQKHDEAMQSLRIRFDC